MAYRRFDLAKIEREPAKVAKVAKDEAPDPGTFAKFATFAGVEPKSEKMEGSDGARNFEREERLAVYGEPEPVGAEPIRKDEPTGQVVHSVETAPGADNFQSRPADWLPEPSPGIRILRPAVELAAAEYDEHLNALIAALPAGSVEAQRLAFAKRKGWVVECEGRRIFTRGRF